MDIENVLDNLLLIFIYLVLLSILIVGISAALMLCMSGNIVGIVLGGAMAYFTYDWAYGVYYVL